MPLALVVFHSLPFETDAQEPMWYAAFQLLSIDGHRDAIFCLGGTYF